MDDMKNHSNEYRGEQSHSHEYHRPPEPPRTEHHSYEYPENRPRIDNSPDKKNPWVAVSLILGVAVIVLLVILYRGGITGNAISGDSAGNKIVEYLNEKTGGGVEFVSTNDLGSLYEINVQYQGQKIPVYMTKDGLYFVQGAVEIDTPFNESTVQKPTTPEAIEVSIDDDAVKGNPDAPVTIVEFSDYECPFCGRHFKQTYPQIVSEYVDTGKVKIVFRDFPLGFHAKAQKAAEAAECAGKQGKYWEMHDKLYENQDALDIENLKQYAKELKLDTNKFNACLDSGEMEDEVQADMDEGSNYGVTGTPAFFINGRLLSGAQPFSAFKQIIDEELNK